MASNPDSPEESQSNNAALYDSANKHLLVFGSAFSPDVIVKTSGIHLYTASGKKLIDWTSGQVSTYILSERKSSFVLRLELRNSQDLYTSL